MLLSYDGYSSQKDPHTRRFQVQQSLSTESFGQQRRDSVAQLVAFHVEVPQDAIPVDQPHRRETVYHVLFGGFIQVPVFVTQGERIRVDTRTGRYVERA